MKHEEILEMGLVLDTDAPAAYQVMKGSYTPISVGAERAREFKTKSELLIYIQETAFTNGYRQGEHTKELEIKKVLGILKD